MTKLSIERVLELYFTSGVSNFQVTFRMSQSERLFLTGSFGWPGISREGVRVDEVTVFLNKERAIPPSVYTLY